jgi:hypothetical protein
LGTAATSVEEAEPYPKPLWAFVDRYEATPNKTNDANRRAIDKERLINVKFRMISHSKEIE